MLLHQRGSHQHSTNFYKNNENSLSSTSEDQESSLDDDLETVVQVVWNKGSISCIRTACGAFVNNELIQRGIIMLIVINGIMMGAGTYGIVRNNPKLVHIFNVVDLVFLVIFTVELVLQFIYHGFYLFLNGWLLFDFVIIIISWAFGSIQIIRAFRIFRALRLVGRFQPLREVVTALLIVVPKLLYISLLLLLVFYVYAVLLTSLFKDMYEEGQTEIDYFSRLDTTSFTLFQIMCLDDWSEIVREVGATYPWSSLLFIAFLLCTTFSVLNMFIAVFCNSVHELEQIRKRKKKQKNPYRRCHEKMDYLAKEVVMLSKSQDSTIRSISLLAKQIKLQKDRNSPVLIRAQEISCT